MNSQERYSQLAPLSLQQQINIACSAIHFFSPTRYREMCNSIGKKGDQGRIQPFTTQEFLSYLSKTGTLQEPDKFQQRVRELLQKLVDSNILILVGHNSWDPLLGWQYYCVREFSSLESQSNMWLAPILGPAFLQRVYSSLLVHITGKTPDGDAHAGTGILLTPNVILTCAHVFEEMRIDSAVVVQGTPREVVRAKGHQQVDIGIIEIRGPCDYYAGLAFQEPSLLDEIYIFGFPKIPFTAEAAMIVHKGEVTNPNIKTLDGQGVFLFSAVARPGNSGGPVVSRNGYMVGIVSRDLFYDDQKALPFYAGTPTSAILKGLAEIDPTIKLKVEDFK